MRDLKFRLLSASDIECRVARVDDNGVQLLLYKDARCDMKILDETVGPANWTRRHDQINGSVYCTVSINVAEDDEDPIWISKQDVGTKSNMEPEKGQASDAFKRACTNWGIGRELYTAPFIWIPSTNCQIKKRENRGKYECKDEFCVGSIEYEDHKIKALTILNRKTRKKVWPLSNTQKQELETKKQQSESSSTREFDESVYVTQPMVDNLRAELKRVGKSEKGILDWLQVTRMEDVTVAMYQKAMKLLRAH